MRLRWPFGASKFSKSEWRKLNARQKYALPFLWRRQNIKFGQMSKRAARTKVREHLRRIDAIRPPDADLSKSDLLRYTYIADELLDAIYPPRRKRWKPRAKRKSLADNSKTLFIPVKDFSFIDNPKESIDLFQKIIDAEATYPPCELDFADSRVQDISSYLLFSILYRRMVQFIDGGINSVPVGKVLQAVGLDKLMGANFQNTETSDIWPFRVREQPPRTSVSSTIGRDTSRSEKVTDELADCISDWLATFDEPSDLTKGAQRYMGDAILEVLCNAERHAHQNSRGGWYIAGFMARRESESGDDRYICHIGIVSLGATIEKTLLNSSQDNEVFWDLMADYQKLGGRDLTDGQRATILALQDGVSCRPAESDSPGGLGMQDLMFGVSYLGAGRGRPKSGITIVSGRTCISVKPEYMPSPDRRIKPGTIWLNEKNSGTIPPDDECIFDIGIDFPGTLIGLRFELDQVNLEKI